MIEALGKHRDSIVSALRNIADQQSAALEAVTTWGVDLRERVFEFAERGKHIRGSLVAAGVELFGCKPDKLAYTTAAGLELVQSFLLIHDDIMDEDVLRRGKPAVHEQYRKLGESRGVRNPQRYGESMGICAGDVAVLLAVEAITAMDGDPSLIQRLVRVLTHEIALVGVAQMADVANGHELGGDPSGGGVGEAEILGVYRHKTGRYTFSLPLMLGATIAKARQVDIDRLSTWGEIQGVIFQIRDDHLNLYGDENETGKPAGTDISSDKQTLHRSKLLSRVETPERKRLLAIYGSQTITTDNLCTVRAAMESHGVIGEIDSQIRDLAMQAERIVGQLETVTDEGHKLLRDIAKYNQDRDT